MVPFSNRPAAASEASRYRAFAFDYDETLAERGKMSSDVVRALESARARGLKLLVVTGRFLNSLIDCCSRLDLFDMVVCENGAVLYHPETRSVNRLAGRPDSRLLEQLEQRGVDPILIGDVMVATLQPHESSVREVIRSLGLSMEIELNKQAIMLLPAGITKKHGLAAALERLGVSCEQTVGVGDAENDLQLLAGAGLAVAVSNALPVVKEAADLVLSSPSGEGVVELFDRILVEDTPD